MTDAALELSESDLNAALRAENQTLKEELAQLKGRVA